MAAEEGLYSLKVSQTAEPGSGNLVKISGIDRIKRIKILKKLRLVLFVCGEYRLRFLFAEQI